MATNIPDEAGKLSGDGGDRGFGAFAGSAKRQVSAAQSFLRIPGALGGVVGSLLRLALQVFGVARRIAIDPGAFGENAAQVADLSDHGDGGQCIDAAQGLGQW